MLPQICSGLMVISLLLQKRTLTFFDSLPLLGYVTFISSLFWVTKPNPRYTVAAEITSKASSQKHGSRMTNALAVQNVSVCVCVHVCVRVCVRDNLASCGWKIDCIEKRAAYFTGYSPQEVNLLWRWWFHALAHMKYILIAVNYSTKFPADWNCS